MARSERKDLKKAGLLSLLLIVLLIAVPFNARVIGTSETQDQQQSKVFNIRMDVTYSNPSRGRNVWNFTEDDRTVDMFLSNAWQTGKFSSASFQFEMKFDVDGNPIAVLQFPKSTLKPGENLSFTTTFQVISKPRIIPNISEQASGTINEIPANLKEEYCTKGDNWQVDNPNIRSLAFRLMGNETSVLTIVKEFIIWIKQNINYFVGEVPTYPNETLASHEGKCDDQAILFATLCRIVGIPAYIQVGCIYQPTTNPISDTFWNGHVTDLLNQIAWHAWAVAYIPPWGFLPIDLTYVADWSNPLNAIKDGGVTQQDILQYMNVSQTDYIAQSLQARQFLEQNNFNIFEQDHMNQVYLQTGASQEISNLWPYLVATAIIAVISISSTYILIATRKSKRPVTQEKARNSKAR